MLTVLASEILALIGKVVPDRDKAEAMAHDIATMAEKYRFEIDKAQIEVNREEAKGGWFRAGWRPLIGYTCAVAFMWHFILQPVAVFILTLLAIEIHLPEFDMDSLMTVMLGMLGLGAYRSFEKVRKIP